MFTQQTQQDLQNIYNFSEFDKEQMNYKTRPSEEEENKINYFLNIFDDKSQSLMEVEFQPVFEQQKNIFQAQLAQNITYGQEKVQDETNQDMKHQIKLQNETLETAQYQDQILSQKNIYVNTVKNTNFPKFLLKNLQSYFQEHSQKLIQNPVQITNVARKIRRLKYRNKSKNLTALKSILRKPAAKNSTAFMTRLIMNDILLQKRREQIIQNNHVHNKKSYLNAAKILGFDLKIDFKMKKQIEPLNFIQQQFSEIKHNRSKLQLQKFTLK